jgi:UDP-N-acetylglucosamine 1-carboxyvinyltransferase
MVSIKINGGNKIQGEVLISGAKNSSMPIIIASTLTSELVVLNNVPHVSDVTTLLSLLIGASTKLSVVGGGLLAKTLKLQTQKINFENEVGLEASKIRTSVLLIGPALARNGYVKLLKPGGCDIGERKIDFHIEGMKAFGAEVLESEHYIELTTHGKKLKGTTIEMSGISVGATQNLLMAATLAEGETVIKNAAIEPEIEDLITFLNKMGAKITKEEGRVLKIVGVEKLDGCTHEIIPDRIEAITYGMLSCATGGEILLKNVSRKYLGGGIETLEKMGIFFEDIVSEYTFGSVRCYLKGGNIKPIEVETEAFPGFATDLQPQLSVLLLLASGVSKITENIFENRFQHIVYLQKMGANITFEGKKTIVIKNSQNLNGAIVEGTDLRACAALIMAGLLAKGETILRNAESVDRGYCKFVKNIANCGGEILRIN